MYQYPLLLVCYVCFLFYVGHKFKEAEKINAKYEPGPWYGASLRTKKLVPKRHNYFIGTEIYAWNAVK